MIRYFPNKLQNLDSSNLPCAYLIQKGGISDDTNELALLEKVVKALAVAIFAELSGHLHQSFQSCTLS